MKKVYATKSCQVEMMARLHLPCGNCVKVHFTGGCRTERAVQPATFVTEHEVTQMLIESSVEFRHGDVVLLRSFGSGRNRAAEVQGEMTLRRQKETVEPKEELVPHDINGRSDENMQEGSELSGMQQEEQAESETDIERIVVRCNADAASVLKERFNIPLSKTHNRQALIQMGEEKGIEFVFEN